MEKRRWICPNGQGYSVIIINDDNTVKFMFLSEPACRLHYTGKVRIKWDYIYMGGTLYFYDMVDKFDNDRPVDPITVGFVEWGGEFVYWNDDRRVVTGTKYILDKDPIGCWGNDDYTCIYYDLNDEIESVSIYKEKEMKHVLEEERKHTRRHSTGDIDDIEYTYLMKRKICSWYYSSN